MKRTRHLTALMVTLVLAGTAALACQAKKPAHKAQKKPAKVTSFDFENVATGQIPRGWKVEGTRQRGPLATWKVIEASDAPSGKKVLAITSINHNSAGTFNLCWTPDVRFKDGEITLKFKAMTGHEDQGGGIMWRVKDKNNYYVVRFNPLEDNFRFYYVKDSHRHLIKSARLHLSPGWHTMKIVMRGKRFEGYIDGKKYLTATSGVFGSEGGVGIWTKADAASMFDDFVVRAE